MARSRELLEEADLDSYEEAVSVLREALDAEPGRADAHALLAEAYSFWGFRREVAGEPAAELYRLALDAAQTALRLAPELAGSHRGMAVALRRGEAADATRRLEESMTALDLDGQDPANWLEYWRASGYDPSDGTILHALELAPGWAAAHIDFAAALAERGRLDEAQAQLVEALRLSPANALAHFDLAMVLERKGEGARARKVLERGRGLHPGDPLLDGGAALLEPPA